MYMRKIIAAGMLAAGACFAFGPANAAEPAKDPKSGKNCVIFMSSELTNVGRQRMNYRNICGTKFQIRIQGEEKTRAKAIEAGTPEKPSTAFITCLPDDRCETAKWSYE